jgi:CubicO group peptidase (beta-lactamase class C family)
MFYSCKVSLILFLILPQDLTAQTKIGELRKGIRVSEEIKPGEIHQYTVSMNADQFAFFRVLQKGIDVKITTHDVFGNKLEDFDTPNGRYGEETASLVSVKKGMYLVEVGTIEEKGPAGSYFITLEKLEATGSTNSKITDQMFSPWSSLKTPGAAVGVVRNGEIILKKGFGSANLEYDLPVTQSTIFNVASLSKQFTAFSILLLEKNGKLNIDDDIRSYVPEVPDFGKKITLRHLLNHTSGLRDESGLLGMSGLRMDDIITRDYLLTLVSHQKELNFAPGDMYEYCNTGYFLLAEAVARVSGQSFAEFTGKNIFEPLNMEHTFFCDDYERIIRNRADSYIQDSTGYKKCVLNENAVGQTNLMTTVEDLCLWVLNFEKLHVGTSVLINKMSQPAVLNNGTPITYAMGQFNGNYKNLKYLAHYGSEGGYRTFLVRFPEQRFSVIVLSNYAWFDPAGIAFKITENYLKDQLKTEVLKNDSIPSPRPDTKSIEIDGKTLKSYCGLYEFQPGYSVNIFIESNQLFLEPPPNGRIQLIAVSPIEFIAKDTPARITFNKDEKGLISKITIKQGGQESVAVRMPDFDPSRVVLAELTGDYYSPELSTTYSLSVKSGKLIANHFRAGDIVLTPSRPDRFTSDKWYFKQLEFERDKDKNITGFKVSGGGVTNLRFRKVKE